MNFRGLSLRRNFRCLPLLALATLLAVVGPIILFCCCIPDLSSLALAPYLRSLLLGLLAASGALMLGIPAAWALADQRGSSAVLRIGGLAVLMIPPYLAASAWLGMAGRLGWLALSDGMLSFMPGQSAGFINWGNLPAAAGILAMSLWPLVAMPCAVALTAIGRSQREAARLALGKAGCFRHLELPVVWLPALAGGLIVFLLAAAEQGVPDLFGVTTAARDMLFGLERGSLELDQGGVNYSLAAGRALPVLVASGLLLLVGGRWFSRRKNLMRFFARGAGDSLQVSLMARIYCSALLAVSLGGVLLGLLANAASSGTLLNILTAAGNNWILLLRSLMLGLASASLAVGGALLLLAALRGRSGSCFWAVLGLLSLPLLLPSSIWGIGVQKLGDILLLLGGLGRWLGDILCRSGMVLIWIGAARATLGAFLILAWGRSRIDDTFFEAGRLAGLGSLARLFLAAGLMKRFLASALLVALALAIGELGATVQLCPPGCSTLCVKVFNTMHNQHGGEAAGLALLAVGGVVILGALAALIADRRR